MAPGKTPKPKGKTDVASPYSGASRRASRASVEADSSKLIATHHDALIKALHTRIDGPIYGIGTLRRYLENANWVVDVAYEVFMVDYWTVQGAALPAGGACDPISGASLSSIAAAALGEHESMASGTDHGARVGLPDNLRGVPVIIHTNREEQRREAVRLLRTAINIDRDPNNKLELTLSEATLTLVLTGWDVEAAVAQWQAPDIIRWQLHHTFDHLRPQTVKQVEIDERLARLVQVTGRDDWHSLQKFLKTHNQCFIQAVAIWYRSGIPAVRPGGWDSAARQYLGRRVGWNGRPLSAMPSDNDCVPRQINGDSWPSMETTSRPAGVIPADPAAQPPKDLRTTTTRQRGFALTPEGDAPVVGAVDPSKFVVDYIKNGKYWANEFPWKKYFWPQLPQSDDNNPSNPTFNWDTLEHTQHLGKWRRQQYSRIEKTKTKETPQDFCEEELNYLFELFQRHVQKLLSDNPGKTRDDFLPLSFRKGATQKLENDFNQKFEGKKPGGATEPRRPRNGNSLKVKACRQVNFQKAFKLRDPNVKRRDGTTADDGSETGTPGDSTDIPDRDDTEGDTASELPGDQSTDIEDISFEEEDFEDFEDFE